MTTYVVYSHEGAINNFFSSNKTMQGVRRYTITAGPNKSKLFQFREENFTINIGNISLAKAVHFEFLARCKYLSVLGDLRLLYIYEMENLPRTASLIAGIPSDSTKLVASFIGEPKLLYMFFAQSWNNNQSPYLDKTAILLGEFQYKFDILARERAKNR
ncbi:uncharacterized protein N7479_009013 [Penicillium vulpinum]|uniref:uncharacterized protein n=1 Tax=Penicillium vulpinum TaxID=29845 RepID=UPI0025487405|nr:uncharacterized protein N7479_009013 [Penicillium vulpinum]KAJ5950600.1 hypothetical protein N7479_009013 [Penicillium vulpinum]